MEVFGILPSISSRNTGTTREPHQIPWFLYFIIDNSSNVRQRRLTLYIWRASQFSGAIVPVPYDSARPGETSFLSLIPVFCFLFLFLFQCLPCVKSRNFHVVLTAQNQTIKNDKQVATIFLLNRVMIKKARRIVVVLLRRLYQVVPGTCFQQ